MAAARPHHRLAVRRGGDGGRRGSAAQPGVRRDQPRHGGAAVRDDGDHRVPPRARLAPPPPGPGPEMDRVLVGKSLAALALALCGFFAGLSLAGTAVACAALLLVAAGRAQAELLGKINYRLLVFFAALF